MISDWMLTLTLRHFRVEGVCKLIFHKRDRGSQVWCQLLLNDASRQITLKHHVRSGIRTEKTFNMCIEAIDLVIRHVSEFLQIVGRDDEDASVIAPDSEDSIFELPLYRLCKCTSLGKGALSSCCILFESLGQRCK